VNDGTGLAEALLGLPGFRVLQVTEEPAEVVVVVETIVELEGCAGCGTRAVAHERRPTAIRDLACFGRPARLVWRKRRWRCPEPACVRKTWTETSEHLDAQVVFTRRAGAGIMPAGRRARPAGVEGGRGAGGVLVDGDERCGRAWHPAGRRPRPGRCGAPPRDRRDVVS
jgi:hypothetical protein